ncbi:imelysin family protein [Apibacter raozihei]|uniref:imelysin family protein n=1 Tax=Apibacter raozihei TaxID=2500547 RepID=UPI000FE31F03|nr:imelysin family protein [Apibacter raozihei]
MKRILFYLSLATAGSLFFQNCSNNDSNDIPVVAEEKKIENIVANNADRIVENYRDLYTKTLELQTAVNAIQLNDVTTLNTAKEAWRKARVAWENSEAFLFGPVHGEHNSICVENVDDAIDTWPIDVTTTNQILDNNKPITAEVIDGENTGGFHALEYMLWAERMENQRVDFIEKTKITNSRELEFAKAVAQNLVAKTKAVKDAWEQEYYYTFTSPSVGNKGDFLTYKDVLIQLIEGMQEITGEVANKKIGNVLAPKDESGNPIPGASADLTQEESRFSKNSVTDFADNIQGVKNSYTGIYGTSSGVSLSNLLKDKNPVLDTKIINAMDAAIASIKSLGNFTNAVINNPTAVEQAQEKVNDLQLIIDQELKPYIQNNF